MTEETIAVRALRDASEGAAVYLRPLAPLRGGAAAALVRDGCARPFGADAAFAAVELRLRVTGSTATRAILPAAGLADRLAGACPPVRARVEALLRNLAAPPVLEGLPERRPLVMGVLNVTPDSFSDGGRFRDPDRAVAHGLALAGTGADLIDVGGESTRPGAVPVPEAEEAARVLPVVERLAAAGLRVSIDSRKPGVLRAAAGLGAAMLNDVTALADPKSLEVAAASGLPVVLMHSRGDPRTMQLDPRYDDVVLDVYDHLEARLAACARAGIPRSRLVVDPGIGFGKTLAHNLALLEALALYRGLGVTLLLGASRKGLIAHLSSDEPADRRLPGSLALALHGAREGAGILRVHDVAETRQALAVAAAAAG